MTNQTHTTSRRAILNAAPAAVAAALAGGTVANAITIGMAKAGEADPVFAVIDNHVKTMEAWFDMMRRKGGTRAESKAIDDLSAELCSRESDASFAVVMAQPTTLEGVCALLDHVAQHQFLDMTVFENEAEFYEDSYETVLSAWNLSTSSERKELADEFPLRMADAIRNIIARGQA